MAHLVFLQPLRADKMGKETPCSLLLAEHFHRGKAEEL